MKILKRFMCLMIILLVTFSNIYSEDEYDKELIKKSLNKVVIIKVKGETESLYVHKKAGFLRVKSERWEGSGVILSSDGIIVTNNHVVEGGDKITVLTYNKKKYTAKVLVLDPYTDLALIRIDADNLEYMEIGDINKLEEGDDCWAVGNTLGLGFNISKGMITSLNQNILHYLMIERFLRFNAKINHGNSGGALINKNGELIGIPTIKKSYDYKEQKMYDFNLAIPAYMIKALFRTYKRTKTFYRSWIGIAVMQNNQKNRDYLNFKGSDKGYLIEWVFPNTPAKQRGLKRNDVILEINDVKFQKLTAIQDYIYSLDPGTEINV
ncbi:trypsin-like peptidase domain-containing protein, partial [Candidatus Dependentiae bacterium]|nr:trypsin-like peptidase domain-containing protein [Candidatus Dependentiae bacterium]